MTIRVRRYFAIVILVALYSGICLPLPARGGTGLRAQIPPPAVSASPAPVSQSTDSLTLSRAVETALARHRSIDSARKAVQAAELNFSAVSKNRAPKVSLGYSYTRLGDDWNMFLDDPTTGDQFAFPILLRDNFLFSTGLMMPLYTGGAQELAEEIARLGIDLSRVKLLQAMNELVLSVKCYYCTVLKEQHFVSFLEQNLERYRTHENVTRKLHAQGMVAGNSLMQARVERANAETELAGALLRLEIARSSLNLAMGLDLSAKFMPEDITPREIALPSLDQCIAIAREHNPELVAFTFLKGQTERAARLERAANNPNLYLSANYYRYGDTTALEGSPSMPNSVLAAMLNIKWQIFDAGQKNTEAKVKESQLAQINDSESLLLDSISLKIKQSLASMDTARKNIETTRLALDSARENLRVCSLRYKEQIAPASDMIDALADAKRAELSYYTAVYEYNLALARLEYAMGVEMDSIVSSGEWSGGNGD